MVTIGSFAKWLIIALVLIVAVGYTIIIYNGLIRLKRNIEKSWKDIDVLLKQRHDEIPKLVDICREYMEYEKQVIKEVTEERTEAEEAKSPEKQAEAENSLNGALGNLFAVAEDYPELRSTENFQQLQKRISSLEDQIADRREFYNSTVTTYNIRINQIPYNLIANLLRYKEKELYQVPEEEKQEIDISKAFEE